MAFLWKIDYFNHNSDDISEYIIFLTVIRSDTYREIYSWKLIPVSLSTKTVEELSKILKKHLKPQPMDIADRCNLYYKNQNENETTLIPLLCYKS